MLTDPMQSCISTRSRLRTRLRHAALAILGATALAAIGAPQALADDNLFFFYSPDWRPADLGALTKVVENLTASEDLLIEFQAFTRYEDFIERIGEVRPAFLWAPTWLEKEAGPFAFELEPLARPMRNGRSTYRKGLMSRSTVSRVQDLNKHAIAATTFAMGADGDQLILDAFDLDPAETRVVSVQKDIDALLALSFGQVDAALVTSYQFEHHSKTNPGIVRDFQILALSPEIDFPAVYATPLASAESRRQLTQVLIQLGDSEAGKELLSLLGYAGLEATH
jgi:hypothetical protein